MAYIEFKGHKIIKRNDNRYCAKFYKNKKAIYVYGKTQKDCYLNLKKALSKPSKKDNFISKETLFYDYVDFYVKTYKEGKVTTNTIRALKSYIKNHIKVHFENKPIFKYTSIDITNGLDCIKTTRTKQECFIYLKAIFNQAFTDDLIDKDLFKKLEKTKHEREEGVALTREQRKIFLENTYKIKHGDIFRFYYYSGARKSEALNLTAADIEKDVIHLPGTKTAKSNRYIPKFKQLQEIISKLDLNNKTLFNIAEITLKREKEKLIKLCGFHINIKDLRTTFGTMCAEMGIQKDVIAKWMGHTTTKTTEKYYIKILSDFEKQQIQNFDNHFDN